MKQFMLLFGTIASLTIMACNDDAGQKPEQSAMDHENMPMDHKSTEGDITMVKATFQTVDPGVGTMMNSLSQQYLALKNALVHAKEQDAVTAAEKMTATLKGFDRSLLTAEQKAVYDNNADQLKTQAESIARGTVDSQRDHFAAMSSHMYNMVKAFGAGMTLYHDHCPMAMDNKGAMWLSESKDIRNPYFGDKMMTCGSVEEMIQ